MKFTFPKFLLPVLPATALFLASCSDDDDSGSTPAAAMLPQKITWIQKYNADPNLVHEKTGKYSYDNLDRLVSYELSVDNANTPESDKTVMTISYEGERVAGYSTVQTGTDEEGNMLETVTGSVTFGYPGDRIVSDDNARTIWTDDEGRVVKYELNLAGQTYPNTYRYDLQGNIKTANISGRLHTYDYDGRSGVFSAVNTPQWFLVTQLHMAGNIVNNRTGEYIDENEDLYLLYDFDYTRQGYPQTWTDYSAPDWIGYWGSTKTITYTPANGNNN